MLRSASIYNNVAYQVRHHLTSLIPVTYGELLNALREEVFSNKVNNLEMEMDHVLLITRNAISFD
ncbi:hypothetical protein EWB00_011249 [Schistosoma japonicum]|uniref:Uncharacterized protein n=1 Tax=Schistosoma japonicum TaxID=6182 RepID=A0A4Z2DKT7_SCHJA|nr:hypothetical protein EWB00_011249 [Schistosoma japonicum]